MYKNNDDNATAASDVLAPVNVLFVDGCVYVEGLITSTETKITIIFYSTRLLAYDFLLSYIKLY